jgi:hypothetical protein
VTAHAATAWAWEIERYGAAHDSCARGSPEDKLPKDVDGDPAAKTIKHAHFNEAWVMQGDAR